MEKQVWKAPAISADSYRTGLRVANSLWQKEPVEFVPVRGRRVNWYICGPTVYSESHLGHAKTYLCFDTIRKILVRHFRYEVYQVMNVTNIDDKIIAQARAQGRGFAELADFWEADFFEVMRALDVDPPETITRVTEFVPDIVRFIEGLLKNGFAYESNGSVYFDVRAFVDSGRHAYPKLKPNAAKSAEENPELTDNAFAKEKRSATDFALWKRAREESEPGWDSPWGRGRPGWHVECSAMCAAAFESWPIDLHSGGEDLKFPHHDNELAQSEGFFDCAQWINYFLHTGRLDIKGQKMSKSLKNFTKIKDALKEASPRVLRLFYSQTRYDSVLGYDPENKFAQARDLDDTFREFFMATGYYLRNSTKKIMGQPQRLGEAEARTVQELLDARGALHEAFCDNFNTPRALLILAEVVNKMNAYIKERGEAVKWVLVKQARDLVAEFLHSMGLDYLAGEEPGKADLAGALADELVRFRGEVKQLAKEKQTGKILELCDELRDARLLELGIKVEDQGGSSIWKQSTREELLREKAEKEGAKDKGKKEASVKAVLSPAEFFAQSSKFKSYKLDEQGVPAFNEKGEPIAKKDREYCEKMHKKQAEEYEKYLNSLKK